jgi:hypothetical protein
MRLTRKQVKEALETIPIEQALFGAVGAKEIKLSPKDREFARQIALGESKASAYRKSRPSRAKPENQSRRGVELMGKSQVQAQVEAFRAAFEAQKYQTPQHLRALAIHELTKHALNEDCPPAQRIKALELIGKMTEVALFTERREIVQVTDSGQIKERLLDTLRTITQAEATDVTDTAADSLLAELVEPTNSMEPDTEPTEAQITEAHAPEPEPEPTPGEPPVNSD